MANLWMVRAGEGGYQIESFEHAGCVAIGWDGAGDFTSVTTLDEMRDRVRRAYPEAKPGSIAVNAGMAFKFRHAIAEGDRVVTYDPSRREYLVGTITGQYSYHPGLVPDYAHTRKVTWDGRVSRDALSPSARNTLGSVLTVFEPGEDVLMELEDRLRGVAAPQVVAAEREESQDDELDEVRRDTVGKAREFIKDRILALSADDLEELVAALLRAMGYKARVTPKGPDRGRDVIASPDGLGFKQPRIMAEVKHRRNDAMGSQQVRSFLGALRGDDRGLYVSTGGFTREAKYEAERASVPITLVDLEDLTSLIIEHYDGFDLNGRSLLPLIRVYWPS